MSIFFVPRKEGPFLHTQRVDHTSTLSTMGCCCSSPHAQRRYRDPADLDEEFLTEGGLRLRYVQRYGANQSFGCQYWYRTHSHFSLSLPPEPLESTAAMELSFRMTLMAFLRLVNTNNWPHSPTPSCTKRKSTMVLPGDAYDLVGSRVAVGPLP